MLVSSQVPLDVARTAAERVVEILAPYAEPGRIEIAGSVRRGNKALVKDIEIVAVGRPESDPNELFANTEINALWGITDRIAGGEFEGMGKPKKGEDAKAAPPWGKRQRVIVVRIGRGKCIRCEVYIVDEEAWFPQLIIRTGPAEFGAMLVRDRTTQDGAMRGGWRIAEHGRLQKRFYDSDNEFQESWETVVCESEAEVFERLQLSYIKPCERSERSLRRAMEQGMRRGT